MGRRARFIVSLIPLLVALTPVVFAGLITIENDVIIAGRLGINTYYPQYPLEVHGNAYIAGYLNAHELRENGVPLENIYAKIAWIQENFYNKSKVDQLILGNVSELKAWIGVSYYDKDKVDQLIIGNFTELQNWVKINYYNASKVDELIIGNKTEIEAWVQENFASINHNHDDRYYTKTQVDQFILGNKTEVMDWIQANYYDRSKVDQLILGNKTEIEDWVQANYYTKSEIDSMLQNYYTKDVIDSWNLIKNYVLQQDLNANGHNVFNGLWFQAVNVSADYFTITENKEATGWYLDYFPDNGRVALVIKNYGEVINVNPNRWVNVSGWLKVEPMSGTLTSYPPGWTMGLWTFDVYAEGTVATGKNGEVRAKMDSEGNAYFLGKVAIGTTSLDAQLTVANDLKIYNPEDARYIRFFFGALNDMEFNGAALVIHPTWSRYDPSAVLYLSGDPNNFRVGIGTDAPAHKLDVNGDAKVRGHIYAEYFRLTEGYCWGSVTGSCSGWEIDYYPEGSMVFRYTNDSGQTFTDMMKIYPFGVAMPFIFDKTMISRLEKIETFGKTVNGWTTVLDADYHGVVAVIFHNPWGAIDYVRVTIDGVTSTIPIDGHTTAEVPLPLVFVVDKHIKVELYSATSVNVYYTVMWIRG